MIHSNTRIVAPILFGALIAAIAIAGATETNTQLDRYLKYLSISEFLPVAADALSRYNDESKTKAEFKRLPSNPEVESVTFGDTLVLGDTQLNRIIATGRSEHLRVIDQLLDELDRRSLQVHLQVVIARITQDEQAPSAHDILRSVEEVQVAGTSVSVPDLLHQRPGSDLTFIDPAPPYSNKVPDRVALLAGDSLLHSYTAALEAKASVEIVSRAHYVFKTDASIELVDGSHVIALIVSEDEILLQFRFSKEAPDLSLNNREPRIESSRATTVRLWSSGIVILPGLTPPSDDFETFLFLQPFLMDAGKAKLE